MNKQDIFRFLDHKGIWFEITEHKAVYNMADLSLIDIPYPGADAKNLFLRDDKRRNYYLITAKGNKKINLKEFRKTHQIRPLSFASETDLMNIMGLTAGSVTPLGILNDTERRVKVFLDRDFLETPGIIGVHPNDNTATIWLKTENLISIIKEHGNEIGMVSV